MSLEGLEIISGADVKNNLTENQIADLANLWVKETFIVDEIAKRTNESLETILG